MLVSRLKLRHKYEQNPDVIIATFLQIWHSDMVQLEYKNNELLRYRYQFCKFANIDSYAVTHFLFFAKYETGGKSTPEEIPTTQPQFLLHNNNHRWQDF